MNNLFPVFKLMTVYSKKRETLCSFIYQNFMRKTIIAEGFFQGFNVLVFLHPPPTPINNL